MDIEVNDSGDSAEPSSLRGYDANVDHGARVIERLWRALTANPHAGAVWFGGRWCTWGDMAGGVASLTERFDAQGVAERSAVGVIMRNRPGGIASLLAVLAANRCPVLISPIQPGRAIAAAVERLRLPAVIAAPDDWGDDLSGAITSSRTVGFQVATTGTGGVAVETRQEVQAVGTDDRFVVGPGVALFVPTSGTTGPPKLVPVLWTQLPIDPGDDFRCPTSPQDRPPAIIALSGATISGLRGVLQAIGQGRGLVLLERLDVEEWARVVRQFQPKRAGLPPAAMRALLDARVPPEWLASIEAWTTGSAPLDPDLKDEFEATYGIPVLVSYGATEFAGPVARWTIEDHAHWGAVKRGSVGRAVDGVSLRVVAPDAGRESGRGEQGLLEVRQRNASGDTGPWIRTNDLARIDTDGFVFIDGRADNVVVRGGFKVSLDELEEVMRAHPAVRDVAAVGIPDPRLGEVPSAVVAVHDQHEVSEVELKDWVRARLAPYKVPTIIRFSPELPRGASYKVPRSQLQEVVLDGGPLNSDDDGSRDDHKGYIGT